LELESAGLIIKLLQEGGNTTDIPEVVKPVKTGKPSDLNVCDISNHKQITVANNQTRNSSLSSLT
jgi:hypothetical protein